jgi:hypothetical protein
MNQASNPSGQLWTEPNTQNEIVGLLSRVEFCLLSKVERISLKRFFSTYNQTPCFSISYLNRGQIETDNSTVDRSQLWTEDRTLLSEDSFLRM